MRDHLILTASEIGTLWGQYINGTMMDIVNRYMVSIIDDQGIKNIFEDAVRTFYKQKEQVAFFIQKEGFPVPVGFTEEDLRKAPRLFSDLFCLNYLHIMTLHGLIGHNISLSVSVNKNLREFYDSCDNEGKRMFKLTTDMLLEKGSLQHEPYFYPTEETEFVSESGFISSFLDPDRPISATEVINLSFNLKKSMLGKTLAIGFSQVAKEQEVITFLLKAIKKSENHTSGLAEILKKENLPLPQSFDSEVTTSTESPFSDKLIMYHIGFLIQTAQAYHGIGLSGAMRSDLAIAYEKTILENLAATRKWFAIMVKHKWLEQPPLAANRKRIAVEKK
ncbi:DUF3231 family protein [Bacillus sp. T3]|uniref:DUF3231 family protein n=1 Tax=Bacillus sp. T3 TaxID=467262 RepID=UPI00298148E1|nr:DUF3231 family protein [Bacillus sp. T3]